MQIIICPKVKIEKKIELCKLYSLIVKFFIIIGYKLLKKEAGGTPITFFSIYLKCIHPFKYAFLIYKLLVTFKWCLKA